LSNCSQRTDVFVSGIRPQAWRPAVLFVVPADEIVTAARPTSAARTPIAVTFRETCFTYVLLPSYA
jgi:hypothetical protein